MRLSGRVAIITGAASGIGLATAQLAAREGAVVALVDMDEQRGEAAVRGLREAGTRAQFLQADVSVEAQVREVVERVVREFGPPTVLFNNAGIAGASGWEASESEVDAILGVNVKGAYWGFKHVVPHMRSAGGGAIVTTSSMAAMRAGPARSPLYAASKAALVAFTATAAVNFAQYGIRVNAVAPGMVDTAMSPLVVVLPPGETDWQAVRNRGLAATVPMGRSARPEEIAALLVFLASEEASYITGAVIPIDGGVSAR